MSTAGPLLAIREAFISLLPFYIVLSILELGVSVFTHMRSQGLLIELIGSLHLTLVRFFPMLVSLAIGYSFSKYKKLDPLQGTALSVFCFNLVAAALLEKYGPVLATPMAAMFGIFLPFMVVYLLAFVQARAIRVVGDVGLSPLLTSSINAIIPAVVTVAVVCCLLLQFAEVMVSFEGSGRWLNSLPLAVQGALRMFVANLLWAFGLHGQNLYNLVVGTDDMKQVVVGDFTMASLINTFVLFGGSGGTLCLLLAMAFRRKLGTIGKISAPLQLFNINEIMVYGHPIVFNPYLIVPFVLYPVIGFLMAYAAVSSGLVAVTTNVQWMMPVGFSAYMAGDGNLPAIFFQLAMLLFGALLYYPFLVLERTDSMVHKLEKLFSDDARPQLDISNTSEMRYAMSYQKRLTTYTEAMQAIELLTSGKLCLYYQPKICIRTLRVQGFEALLRVQLPDGKVIGPGFVGKLEAAGYSDSLNAWVVQEAVRNLQAWKLQGFEPVVSVNVTADFLSSFEKVAMVIERVDGFAPQIKLEMLESSFANDFAQIQANVEKLRQCGIGLAIDDFGSGYSNLALLNKLSIETIKMDKSILDDAGSAHGQLLYRELCLLIKKFGYELVSEGVETQAQADFVAACGVDVIQGWLYSPALPPQKAMEFARQREPELAPVP